jgi:hypothetical protein
MTKAMFVAVVCSAGVASRASGGTLLTGEPVAVQVEYGIYPYGGPVQTLAPGSILNVGAQPISITYTDASITIAGCVQGGFCGVSFTSAPFNGTVFNVPSNVTLTNVGIDPSTLLPGFVATDVSFTAQEIQVNLAGLDFANLNDQVVLDLSGTVTPEPLINFQGGSSSAPVVLPSGMPVWYLTGTIGGLGSQDYYSFLWAGGAFNATASITGTPNAGASYLFSEGTGSCTGGGSSTLNSGDSFTGTIAVANLAPGQYCIGIDANNSNDPAFALTFNTPIEAATPEPSTFALIPAALGLIGALRYTRIGQRHS